MLLSLTGYIEVSEYIATFLLTHSYKLGLAYALIMLSPDNYVMQPSLEIIMTKDKKQSLIYKIDCWNWLIWRG